MGLAELTRALPGSMWVVVPPLPPDLAVQRISWDSRTVRPGDLFFALPGGRVHGWQFLPNAYRQGAVAAVVEGEPHPEGPPIQLQARNARAVMGLFAALLHGEPSKRVRLCGITGTDGKTSCSWITRGLLAAAGRRAVAAGTLGIKGDGDEVRSWDAVAGAAAGGASEAHRRWQPTSPEAPIFQAALRALADEGTQDVIAEVSSHALAQERVLGSQFAVVALTHISRDHLDFHGDAHAYVEAKMRLFQSAYRGGLLESRPVTAVLNLDDETGRELAGRLTAAGPPPARTGHADRAGGAAGEAGQVEGRMGGGCLTVGRSADADLQLVHASATAAGTRLGVRWRQRPLEFEAPLVGRFQVENLLVSAGISLALGLSPEDTARGMRTLAPVPGRFEAIRAGQPFAVVVDYAHTADALTQVLSSARDITEGELIVVFGCGGDRDRAKRPAMGAAAGRAADHVIVTTDNPRSEDPESIIAMVAAGVDSVGATPDRILDRREAIVAALGRARPGDTVLVAGRGAETNQVVGERVEHFDDREVIRDVLARHGAARS